MLRHGTWAGCVWLAFAASAALAGKDGGHGAAGCPQGSPCTLPQNVVPSDTWVDKSFGYMTNRADSLAVWLDSFFGRPESDMEAADSVLRLRMEQEWDEKDDDKSKIRLRGKVDLPRIDKRLSIVFAEEDEDREQLVPDLQHQDTDVGLQYRIRDRDHSRLYLSVGTNADLDFKAAIRYKYVDTWRDAWRLELGERLYYDEDKGYGTLSRIGVDYALDRDHIVRWVNQADYGEETAGVEWSSKLSYQMRLDDRSAFSWFGAVSGLTDPRYVTDEYALGVRYRRSVYRHWVFAELEPAHVWRRPSPLEGREPVWVLTLRLEFLEDAFDTRRRR